MGLVIGCLISLVGLGYCTDAFGFKKFLAANQPGDGEPKIVGGIGGGSDSAGGPSTWKQFSYQVHGFRRDSRRSQFDERCSCRQRQT